MDKRFEREIDRDEVINRPVTVETGGGTGTASFLIMALVAFIAVAGIFYFMNANERVASNPVAVPNAPLTTPAPSAAPTAPGPSTTGSAPAR